MENKTINRTPQFIYKLTYIRYFCALGVVISHASKLLLPEKIDNIFLNFILKSLRELSASAMVGFFLLSGFVMYINYGKQFEDSKINFRKTYLSFLKNRFIRLYPLWVVAIILDFFLWSRTGYTVPDYIKTIPFYLTFSQSWWYLTTSTRAFNYALGMTLGVGWSLSVEWLFYFTFPFILLVFKRFNSKKSLIILTVSIFLVYSLNVYLINSQAFNENSLLYSMFGKTNPEVSGLNNWENSFGRWLVYLNPYIWLSVFIIGCYLAKLSIILAKSEVRILKFRYLGFICLVTTFVLTINSYVFTFNKTLWILRFGAVYVVPLGIYFLSICHRELKDETPFKMGLIYRLGNASYALYLFHFPIINILKDWRDSNISNSNFGVPYVAIRYLIIIFAVHLICLSISEYFDFPIRKFLKNRWI